MAYLRPGGRGERLNQDQSVDRDESLDLRTRVDFKRDKPLGFREYKADLQADFEKFYFMDTTDSALTVYLPHAALNHGGEVNVKLVKGTNPLTVKPRLAQTIDKHTAIGYAIIGESYTFISDGADWRIA